MNHFAVLKSSFIALMLTAVSSAYSSELSLEQAVDYALNNEPWLTANKYQQAAVQAQSLAAGTLTDPVLTFGLMNLPTEGFPFDQEGMTQ